MEFITSAPFIMAFTFVVYTASLALYQKTKLFIFTPLLITVVATIALLKFSGLSYESYSSSTYPIRFWLEPSVVALAIPLYNNIERIKRQWKALLITLLVGSLMGIVSVVLIAHFMGSSLDIIHSIAPKSVTTPIALQISKGVGGIAGITAGVVSLVGIFGAIVGEWFLKLIRVTDPKSIGLAMGSASHGIGVSKISVKGEEYSAFGAIGIVLNGLFTAIFTPIILPLFDKLF